MASKHKSSGLACEYFTLTSDLKYVNA